MLKTASALTELDHLMMAVFDHDAAIAAFDGIGFSVRPVRQLEAMGGGKAGGNGGSAAILLHSATPGCANYIELARADPLTAQSFMKALLCDTEGPAMLVHATSEPGLLAEQWRGFGLQVQQFSFTVPPFGAGEPADIDIVLPDPGQAPFAFNACRYSDASDFERDEWRNHPNGAYRWAGLTLAFAPEELASAVRFYSQIYGMCPIESIAAGACFQPAVNSFELISHNHYREYYGEWELAPIVHIITRDLAATQQYFETRGVKFASYGSHIIIAPDLGCGAAFLFKTQD